MVNILAPIIIRLFHLGLSELVQKDGTLVLSGILDRQVDDVRKAAESYNLKFIEQRAINDWVGLIFKK